MYEFALNYTDNNRKSLLATYPDIATFKSKFVVDDKMVNDMVAYGVKKEVPKDTAGLNTSLRLIKVQLKSLVARDLWNTDAYWQMINTINPFYIKALESLKDDTFDKMKIAGM